MPLKWREQSESEGAKIMVKQKKAKKKVKTPVRRGKITPSKAVSGRKVKKATKPCKKPKSIPPSEFTEQEKSIILHRKIHAVMAENPEIKCTLVGEDEDRKFGICEAAGVFKMYNQAMAKHNLTFIPMAVNPTLGNGCVLVRATYRITDITTGYFETVQGVGLGTNGQWAANTGQTLALKQALLNTFTCSWPQPEDFREEVQRVSTRMFGPAQSPQQISEVIKDFFADYMPKKS